MSVQRVSHCVLISVLLMMLAACETVKEGSGESVLQSDTLLKPLGIEARFQPSSSEKIGMYQVSSGFLVDSRDGNMGSLVAVTSDTGASTVIVDTPIKRGLLLTDAAGKSIFHAEPRYDWMKKDTVDGPVESNGTSAGSSVTNPRQTQTIDVWAGFSKASESAVGDAYAYALAQVETVNLGLSNSRISSARLRLHGVQVIPTDYPITGETLSRLDELFPKAKERGADTIAAFFVGNSEDTAAGWGKVPGRLTVQTTHAPTAFRHEMGHNAGGSHCNTGQDSYKFGYNNGTSRTYLCGNNVPYYSNPDINDEHGKPLGNATMANMARVWNENATRLASYGTPNWVIVVLYSDNPTTNSVRLSWIGNIIPDNAEVYRDGVKIWEGYNTGYHDENLSPSTVYRYHVVVTQPGGHKVKSQSLWITTKD
jgi:hypothetical protein